MRWTPRDGLDLLLEGRASGRVPTDDANHAAAPGHAVLDLAAERRFAVGGYDARLFARLENVADRAYVGSVIVNDANGRWFEPAPGRGVTIGLELTARVE